MAPMAVLPGGQSAAHAIVGVVAIAQIVRTAAPNPQVHMEFVNILISLWFLN
jgi:hypothetical protein